MRRTAARTGAATDAPSGYASSKAGFSVSRIPNHLIERFDQLGLDPQLVSACRKLGITKPTEVQKECIPAAMARCHVVAGAPTGSGKTASFALPILQGLCREPSPGYAVILEPGRELARQVGEQMTALGSVLGLRVCVVVGGGDMTRQAAELSRRPHVVVATPGRLADLLGTSGSLKGSTLLRRTRVLVLDEADRLLTPSFAADVRPILEALPQAAREQSMEARGLQTLLYTATLTRGMKAALRAAALTPEAVREQALRAAAASAAGRASEEDPEGAGLENDDDDDDDDEDDNDDGGSNDEVEGEEGRGDGARE